MMYWSLQEQNGIQRYITILEITGSYRVGLESK